MTVRLRLSTLTFALALLGAVHARADETPDGGTIGGASVDGGTTDAKDPANAFDAPADEVPPPKPVVAPVVPKDPNACLVDTDCPLGRACEGGLCRAPKRSKLVPALPFFWWQKKKGAVTGAVPLLLTGWHHDAAHDVSEVLAGGIGYYKHDHDKTMRALFPLYWDREKQGGRFATILPLFFHHRDGLASQSVFFPFFWRWKDDDKKTDTTVFFPLFDYTTLRGGRRSIALTLLGGYEHDDDEGRTQLSVLNFYHRRDPALALDALLPIFASWKNPVTGSSGMYFGPFVHLEDDKGSTSTLFPIYWHVVDKRTSAQTDVLFPILTYHQHPGFKATVLLTAYGWKRTPVDGVGEHGFGGGLAPLLFFGHSGTRSYSVLAPIFAWSRDSATGKQLTAVGPLFVRQNPPTHGIDLGILPLLFFGHEDQRSYAYIAPVFWYRHTPERTTAVVGPIYGSKATDGYDAGVAPVAFFHKKGQDSSQVVLPLFYRVAHGADSTTVVLPYAHSRHGEQTTDALFPLLFVQRSPGETTVGSLIGGYHRKDGQATGVFGPYIYHADERTHASTHVLFPLAFSHRAPDHSLTAVFPFVWDAHNGAQHDTVIAPLFWHRRGGWTDVDALFPLFVRAKNPHSTTYLIGPVYARHVKDGWTQGGLPGLFSFGEKRVGDKRSMFVGGPAFYYARNDFTGTRRFLFGPLYDTRRPDGYTSGWFPLVFAWRRGNASYAVTPFYYHQADRATGLDLNVIGPLYWGRSQSQTHVGLAPIFFGQYGNGKSKTVVFPLLYFAHRPDGSMLLTFLGGYKTYDSGFKALIGPLYVRRDKDYHSAFLFPLVYHGVNQHTQSVTTVAIPLYFDRQNNIDGVRLQAFTPLVWRYRSVERTVTLGFPLVFDSDVHGESHTTGVLPLFIRHRSEVTKSSWWTVPPLLLWARENHPDEGPKTHDFVFFPLLWHFGGTERSSTVVLPIYWDFRRGENRTQVVFPIMAHWTRPDGDRTVVLNTYYRKGKGPREGSYTLNVIPFFDVSRPRKGDLEWNVLEGLFGYSRLGRNRTLKLFWIIPVTLQPVPQSNLSWWSSTPPSERTTF